MKNGVVYMMLLLCSAVKGQWTDQNAGFTNKTLGFYEISIVDENVVWAICYDGVKGLGSGEPILEFTRTVDGGATWIAGLVGSDTSLAFSNICALSATEAWVAMHKGDFSKGGGIFHTLDGGISWTQSNPKTLFGTESFPNYVYFKDSLNGIAGGDSVNGYFEIYTTSDGGENWQRIPKSSIPDPLPHATGGWFDGFSVIGNTIWFGTDRGQMYKSTDFGTSWSIHTVDPAMNKVYEIAFNDDALHGLTNVRTADNTVLLFSTADGGHTWTQLPPHPNWKRSRITSVPGTSVFVSTSVIRSERGASYTTDNGVSWILIDAEKPKAACRFLNANIGWSGGYFNDDPRYPVSPGIYKWTSTLFSTLDSANNPNAASPETVSSKFLKK